MSVVSKRRSTIVMMMITILFVSFSFFMIPANAQSDNPLNGVGAETKTEIKENEQATQNSQQVTPPKTNTNSNTTTTQTQTPPTNNQGTQSNADAVGSLFENVGVDAEATEKANAFIEPFAKGANVVFAVVLGTAFVGMFVITALDLLYIAVPPVRNLLYPQQAGGGMMGSGMGGMGGYGGGYGGYGGMRGGYGGGMMGGAPQGNFISRFISDEAVAAVALAQGGAQTQGGGMGMGMGMGMMGGVMQQAEPPKTRSIILAYFKKRVFFLFVFGICAILLSGTIFFDLGAKIGAWILEKLMGFKF